MKILDKKISELVFAEYNPRQLSKEQFQQIKDSIARFGIVDPIIVNSNKDRKCYGMELDPHYCDVIVKRWEEFTGKKAELAN
jgi:hypothetical protein